MKKMKKLILLSLALLMIAPMLVMAGGSREAAGSAAADGVVELRIAVPSGQMPAEAAILEEFHNLHPNIRVTEVLNLTSGDWADYFTQVRTLIAGGTPPDVVSIAIEGVQYMVSNNLALGLARYLDMYPEYKDQLEEYHPRLLNAFEYGDEIYGSLWHWNNIVTHINLDMLDDVGLPFPDEDWDQETFLEYATALTRVVDRQQVFGTVVPNQFFALMGWMYAFDAGFLTDDWTESAVNTQEAHDAFQFLYDLVHTYEVAPMLDLGLNDMDRFVSDQVAMIFAGRWPNQTWIQNNKNFNIQYVPRFRTDKVVYGVGGWSVLQTTRHPEEAFKLAMFLGDEFSVRESAGAYRIPPQIALMEEILSQEPPDNWRLYVESADIAAPVQSPPNFPEVSAIVMRHYSALMSGEVSVRRALEVMHREINESLGK